MRRLGTDYIGLFERAIDSQVLPCTCQHGVLGLALRWVLDQGAADRLAGDPSAIVGKPWQAISGNWLLSPCRYPAFRPIRRRSAGSCPGT
ncbi:hypothetical protein [Pseudomonas asplenii]|uniref:hypothetical protein n=1 Tax=Pseudomonas asplenii TaxID=53407 RepID=UPI00036A40DC|nr:hypothetical protein [Pseudomonas fuscovaginae]